MLKRMMLTAVVSAVAIGAIPAQAAGFNDGQKKEIETIIRQYILDNPEILFEASDRYQKKQEDAANEKAKGVLVEKANQLFNNPAYAFLGNKDAKVVFAEFYDYNCGYCKHALPDLVKLTKENNDIKVVLIDTPILGPTSVLAARYSVAAAKLGKGAEFHSALMVYPGPREEKNLDKIAADLGMDAAKVKELINSDAVRDQIGENMKLFSALGLSGTPGFAAPDRVLRGYVGGEVLAQIAKEVKAAQKPAKK